MGPTKKGNRRQEEDWEAELGEAAPGANATDAGEMPEDNAAAAADNEDAGMGGGLLAAVRKNKNKKAKKGKPVNDFVEGEDANGEVDLASKQPEEGTFDEDDVFAGKKQKPIKEVPPPPQAPAEPEEDGEFRVKSKKEKEKERKEREKQRKKEQVCLDSEYACRRPSLIAHR